VRRHGFSTWCVFCFVCPCENPRCLIRIHTRVRFFCARASNRLDHRVNECAIVSTQRPWHAILAHRDPGMRIRRRATGGDTRVWKMSVKIDRKFFTLRNVPRCAHLHNIPAVHVRQIQTFSFPAPMCAQWRQEQRQCVSKLVHFLTKSKED
jgi:hypothetical protein